MKMAHFMEKGLNRIIFGSDFLEDRIDQNQRLIFLEGEAEFGPVPRDERLSPNYKNLFSFGESISKILTVEFVVPPAKSFVRLPIRHCVKYASNSGLFFSFFLAWGFSFIPASLNLRAIVVLDTSKRLPMSAVDKPKPS